MSEFPATEFRLPDGEWRCTRDNTTEPCGDCEGCWEIQAINRSGVRDDVHNTPVLMSRRQYLVLTTIEQTGCDVFLAMEAVASTAIEHPEWDMDERQTYSGWADADAISGRPLAERPHSEPPHRA